MSFLPVASAQCRGPQAPTLSTQWSLLPTYLSLSSREYVGRLASRLLIPGPSPQTTHCLTECWLVRGGGLASHAQTHGRASPRFKHDVLARWRARALRPSTHGRGSRPPALGPSVLGCSLSCASELRVARTLSLPKSQPGPFGDTPGLGQRPVGRCPVGRCPVGRCPVGRCPVGRCPVGRCPVGRRPVG